MVSNIVISVFIVLLSILSCLFSGNETAITSVKPYQWLSRRPQDVNNKKTKIVIRLLSRFSMTIASILVGNTICDIVCSSLVTVLVENNFGSHYVAIATGILALIVLVFGSYLPKTLAKRHPISWLNTCWWLIEFFYILFWPISWLLTSIFERGSKITTSERDVSYFINAIQKEGILEKDEADLVKNSLMFDDTTVASIVLRKFDYVSNKSSLSDIRKKFIETNFSRLPVLNSKGRPVGFLLNKDILRAYSNGIDSSEDFKLKNYLKIMHLVESDAKLNSVLRLMQATNTHMVGVINKNSKKLVGIVTLEMVIEQLVGKIYDEKDRVYDIQIINSYTWLVDPDVNAYKFFKKYLKTKINNKDITVETYLKRTFKFKHVKRYTTYENKKMKVFITVSQKGKELKYQISKK